MQVKYLFNSLGLTTPLAIHKLVYQTNYSDLIHSSFPSLFPSVNHRTLIILLQAGHVELQCEF